MFEGSILFLQFVSAVLQLSQGVTQLIDLEQAA